MKISFSFTSPLAVVVLLIATHLSLAKRGFLGGRGGGGGGQRGNLCYGGQEAIDFFNKTTHRIALTDDECGAEFACQLPRGMEEGRFVCRTRYHPVTGESAFWPTCVPMDKAWDTDVCGCCGETCPDPSTEGCLDSDDEN